MVLAGAGIGGGATINLIDAEDGCTDGKYDGDIA